ncbi:regulatory iron-sulfur-containing complex subunit RicT, partial [Adlercreutzia sp. ZJ305]
MVRVAPINLAYNPRTLWFDPGELDVPKGAPVVVDTARGTEFGRAASDVIEVPHAEVKALKTPLRRVLRLATDEDVERSREMERRGREALPVFKRMVAEANAEMHPVSVEFLLDGDKAVFYFEAEDRIDFRDLVRKLAAHFHVRIDMRQIGVRDEARIVGGLGHCGQELCCKRMGGEFNPVSIRMAKEQDLSLNPQKISGLCGRLMCCLRYEYDAYKDFKSRAPKANATVQTPVGPAKVVELDVPREVVSLKVEGEKPVKVPLADFDEPEEGARPSVVGDDAWDAATADASAGYASDPVTFLTSQFTGSDKLAEVGSVRRTPGGKAKRSEGGKGASGSSAKRSEGGKGASGSSAKSRSRGGSRGRGGAAAHGGSASAADETRKPRRRRSTKIAAGEGAQTVKVERDERPERSERTERGERSERSGRTERPAGRRDHAPADAAGQERKPRRSRNRSHGADAEQARGAQQGG